MHTIAIMNQKGGVGKTSTTHHLAGTLAKKGKRVLLVDNDPQASLTQGLWGPAATMALAWESSVAAIYEGVEPFPDDVVHRTAFDGIDLIPGSVRAARWNLPQPEETKAGLQLCMRYFFRDVAGYDFALIDCPPNLYLCTWAALIASDSLLVPMQPEDYGAQGIRSVNESVAMVRAGANPDLSLLGYLLTMVEPRLDIHKLYEGELRSMYGSDVFRATIPKAAAYKEAVAARQPIAKYKPRGAPAGAIEALAAELLERVEARSATALEV